MITTEIYCVGIPLLLHHHHLISVAHAKPEFDEKASWLETFKAFNISFCSLINRFYKKISISLTFLDRYFPGVSFRPFEEIVVTIQFIFVSVFYQDSHQCLFNLATLWFSWLNTRFMLQSKYGGHGLKRGHLIQEHTVEKDYIKRAIAIHQTTKIKVQSLRLSTFR